MKEETLNSVFIKELEFILKQIRENAPNLEFEDLQKLKEFTYIKEYHY